MNCAKESYEEFTDRLKKMIGEIRNDRLNLKLQLSHGFAITNGIAPCVVTCNFANPYQNTLEDGVLNLDIYRRLPYFPGFLPPIEELRRPDLLHYLYKFLRDDFHCWLAIDEKGREFNAEQLADQVVRTYIDVAELHVERL